MPCPAPMKWVPPAPRINAEMAPYRDRMCINRPWPWRQQQQTTRLDRQRALASRHKLPASAQTSEFRDRSTSDAWSEHVSEDQCGVVKADRRSRMSLLQPRPTRCELHALRHVPRSSRSRLARFPAYCAAESAAHDHASCVGELHLVPSIRALEISGPFGRLDLLLRAGRLAPATFPQLGLERAVTDQWCLDSNAAVRWGLQMMHTICVMAINVGRARHSLELEHALVMHIALASNCSGS